MESWKSNNLRATLRRNYTKGTIARQLLNDLIEEDRRNDDASADERRSSREKRDEDCSLHCIVQCSGVKVKIKMKKICGECREGKDA